MKILAANQHHHYFDSKSLHPDMNFHGSNGVLLGFALTSLFLFFSIWNRILRSRASRDCGFLSEQGFYVLSLVMLLYVILLLRELGFPEFLSTQKEKFWPAPEEPGFWASLWHRLSDFFQYLGQTPSFWSYWFCTQIPPRLIRWYLGKFRIQTESQISLRVWIFFLWPVLIPPVILNYEVMFLGTIKYFYASLVLTLIPLVARLLLAVKWSLGMTLMVQAFRRDHKVKILDILEDDEYLLQVLELIPWDLEEKFIQQWQLGTEIQKQQLYGDLLRKKEGKKVRILRLILLLSGWLGLVLQAQIGYV